MSDGVRRARLEDLPRLADIERSAGNLFRTVGLAEVADAEPASLEFVSSVAAAGGAFVATVDDAPVGFVLVGFLDRAAHIYELSVAEAHGRKGHGRRLMAEACRFAAGEGAPAVTLSTFRDLPWNGPFYERLGFHYLARGEWTPALHMLHHREIEIGLPVARRAFMRKDLP